MRERRRRADAAAISAARGRTRLALATGGDGRAVPLGSRHFYGIDHFILHDAGCGRGEG